MKKQIYLFLAFLFVFGGISAQNKLTLEDAVMQQYQKFAPETMPFFKWLPNTDCYTYLEGYRTLKKASFGNTDAKDWFTIAEVNTALGSALPWFSGFTWKNENEFWLNDGQKYYLFNTVTKKGKTISSLTDDAENATFNEASENIAYTRNNNLYIQDADGAKIKVTLNDDKNIVSGQAIARSEFGITNGIFWSPNGSRLAFYQKDESKVHDYPLLDNDAYPGVLKSIKYPMAGQLSESPKVGIYDIATKNTVFISPRGNADDYLTNLSWTPDNKYVLIAEVNRGQNAMKLDVYDAKTGAYVRTLLEEANDKWIEPEHPAFFPSDKSTNFIWVSEKSGYNNLYYYDFNGKLIKQLTNNNFVCKEIIGAKENGSKIYFSATGPNGMNTLAYSVDLNGKQELVTSKEGTHSVEISTDGQYIFDEYSTSSIPSKSILYNSKGKKQTTLLIGENKYEKEGVDIGTTTIGELKGKDGTVLYTRMIKPKNFDANKKYPVLVYVYGGPHAQMITNSWMNSASLWMHWMADQGYIVYTLDNRGSGERGFAFESQIHRQLGTIEMEDQMTGVEYLKSLPYVDGNRLAVHGWSFGGFMTTSLMLRHAGTFNVGVAGGPVTDWKYYEIMYGERYMDTPEENPEGYKNASLITHADKLTGDLLLISGTVDPVVVMQHSLSLVEKFVDLGIQMDFFPYPMHEHNVRGKDRVHLMQKVLDYIIDNNKLVESEF
ncbi:S9 family peptidase [Crocinitomicaceae bacterium]|nr:S9 family peptidase [Crocinitomicaceae bacterium]